MKNKNGKSEAKSESEIAIKEKHNYFLSDDDLGRSAPPGRNRAGGHSANTL